VFASDRVLFGRVSLKRSEFAQLTFYLSQRNKIEVENSIGVIKAQNVQHLQGSTPRLFDNPH
jgi:hypothetical protein